MIQLYILILYYTIHTVTSAFHIWRTPGIVLLCRSPFLSSYWRQVGPKSNLDSSSQSGHDPHLNHLAPPPAPSCRNGSLAGANEAVGIGCQIVNKLREGAVIVLLYSSCPGGQNRWAGQDREVMSSVAGLVIGWRSLGSLVIHCKTLMCV